MSKNDRPKANDIFNRGDYVFSRQVPFAEAFPTIEQLRVEVTESGYGAGDCGVQGKRARTYSQASASEFINCSNPLCYDGGVRIGDLIRELVQAGKTEGDSSHICQGYEGSPKGRRRYRSCINFFTVKVTIVYRHPVEETATKT